MVKDTIIGSFFSFSDNTFIGGAEYPEDRLLKSPVFENVKRRDRGSNKRFAMHDKLIHSEWLNKPDEWLEEIAIEINKPDAFTESLGGPGVDVFSLKIRDKSLELGFAYCCSPAYEERRAMA